VCLSALAAFPHYCTDPDATWGNGRGCPLVAQCSANLQSVHGFSCYDNIALAYWQSLQMAACIAANANACIRSVPICCFSSQIHIKVTAGEIVLILLLLLGRWTPMTIRNSSFKAAPPFLANVNSRSRSLCCRPSVCRLSVCNVLAPYSAG